MFKTEIIKELSGLPFMSEELSLDKIYSVLKLLDNPQKNYKIIHIAGTNGKGSTAAFLATTLKLANFKVGKFTSPFLIEVNEQIIINDKKIDNDTLLAYIKDTKDIIEKNNINLSYFEFINVVAFWYFADQKIDYLVLEVGLGGRLDSTNVADGDIVAITNVSLDHTDILGHHIVDIAREKFGIIKFKSEVFFGEWNQNFDQIISDYECKNINYPINKYCYYLDYKNFKTIINVENEIFKFNLFGHHQVKNFILAWQILNFLKIDLEIIKLAAENTKWPGRFEKIIYDGKTIIIDAAHNIDGINNLKLAMSHFNKSQIAIITATLSDKDYKIISSQLETISDQIYLTNIHDNHRALSNDVYQTCFSQKVTLLAQEDLAKILKSINEPIVLITGSLYLIGQLKRKHGFLNT